MYTFKNVISITARTHKESLQQLTHYTYD